MDLSPVKRKKTLDVVTDRIREEILSGKYAAGDKLPSEREFVDQLQVSRIVVREALRKLEGSGLLVVKRGSGMFVASAGSRAVHDAVTSALRLEKVKLEEVMQARLMLEPGIAELAAKKRTPEQLKSLKENIEKAQANLDNGITGHYEHVDFHRTLAEATQNRVLRLTVEAVLYSLRNRQDPPEIQIATDTHALLWHRKILRALEERQPEKTAKLMRDHIMEVRKDFEIAAKARRT